jgi:hypothetical protein
MSEATLDARLLERIKAIARRENRPVNALVEDMLAQYHPPGNPNWALEMVRMVEEDESGDWDGASSESGLPQHRNWALELLVLAESRTDNQWNEDAPEASSRRREVKETDYADYLLKRLKSDE